MSNYDLIVFSHLRWDFVYQRPQHLLSRAAKDRRVFYIEEPIFDAVSPELQIRQDASGVTVCIPHVAPKTTPLETERLTQNWVATLLNQEGIKDYAIWFYTPMALPLARNLHPKAVVYDCMDELSAFKFAPPELVNRERQLMGRADVVFTGGQSLFEAKRHQHHNIHAMPSSVDTKHFAQARGELPEPADLANLKHPRVGFIGVVDERMDLELLGGVAAALPDVEFVIVGPVVKIDPATLPQHDNLHYLGGKQYADLPQYLAHWDVAMMPFALNDSTRFISPTKTPEYLSAGKPVVSTPIRDVVFPYGERDLVLIADDVESFAAAVRQLLTEDQTERLERSDRFVGAMSWDLNWRKMDSLISSAILERNRDALPTASLPSRSVPASSTALAPSVSAGSGVQHLPGAPRQS